MYRYSTIVYRLVVPEQGKEGIYGQWPMLCKQNREPQEEASINSSTLRRK